LRSRAIAGRPYHGSCCAATAGVISEVPLEAPQLSTPIVVHVVRPYASELDYLAAEAWSIDARSMLLIDAETLPLDTAVLFDVALSGGQKPIRAEGRVVGTVPAKGDRPGGLKVRFKRFGAATKAFIERAVQAQSQPAAASQPEASSSPQAAPLPEPSRPSAPEPERASMPEVRASMTEIEQIEQIAVAMPVPREPSGVRPRTPGPVAAPANREELLERLRRRRRTG